MTILATTFLMQYVGITQELPTQHLCRYGIEDGIREGDFITYCVSNAPLRLHNDLTDHTLYFVKSADIAVRARRPERVFIILGRIQEPRVKSLRALWQFNVLWIRRLARIGGYRVYLAR